MFSLKLLTIFLARSLLGRLELKESRAYLSVSILMVITFFCCRIILCPLIIYIYCVQLNLGLVQGVLSMPVVCKLGTFLFYSLNLYWFHLMLRGCIKALNQKGLKKK